MDRKFLKFLITIIQTQLNKYQGSNDYWSNDKEVTTWKQLGKSYKLIMLFWCYGNKRKQLILKTLPFQKLL